MSQMYCFIPRPVIQALLMDSLEVTSDMVHLTGDKQTLKQTNKETRTNTHTNKHTTKLTHKHTNKQDANKQAEQSSIT